MSSWTEGRKSIAGVAALVVVAAVLRGVGLNSALWYDEIVTLVEFVRVPLGQVLTSFPTSNNHVLYSILAHASVALLGEQPWTVRLPAYVFGIAGIPVVYALGRTVTTRREALLAAALLTVSYHHVWFSQNARGYTALAFWTPLATLLLLRGVATAKRGPFVGYGLAAALGLYTNLMMASVVAAHVLVCAWYLGRPSAADRPEGWRLAILGFSLTVVLSLLLYAPVFGAAYRFFSGPPPSQAAIAGYRSAIAEIVRSFRAGLGSSGLVAAAILSAVGLWSYGRQSPRLLALFILPGVLVAAAAAPRGWPVRPRFLFPLIGFGALVLVRGAAVIGGWLAPRAEAKPAFGTALILVLLVASAVSLRGNYRYPKQDFEGAMRFVSAARAPEEPVAATGSAVYPYRQYYRAPWTWVESLEDFVAARSGGRRLWLVYTLPPLIRLRHLDLMAAIERDCRAVKVFPGTLGDGDVIVCVAPPIAAARAGDSSER